MSPLDEIVERTAGRLAEVLGKKVPVAPLPKAVTPENLLIWEAYNLRPIFLPGMAIVENSKLGPNWIKPWKCFYDDIRAGKITCDSYRIHPGWHLADFSIGSNNAGGTQVFVNDPLAPLIDNLQKKGMGLDNMPSGSRFGIGDDEWRETLLPALTEVLGDTGIVFRLERAAEFNAIGNIYDSKRGKFDIWEWFDDSTSDLAYYLAGGNSKHGGIACIFFPTDFNQSSRCAGRPFGCFI